MTLHLHIGAHKTATTHMQATLIRHRAMLAEAGVQFEQPDHIRAIVGSGRRAAAKMGALPSLRRHSASRRLALIDRGLERLLISDENSLGRCAEMFEKCRLYPTAKRQLMIWRRLAAGRNTIVYLGVRDYGAFLSGAYVQSIRGGAVQRPDEQGLLALARLARRWTDVVEDIKQALPDARIRIWAFEDYPHLSQGLLREMTGLTLAPVKRRPMATPSRDAIEAYLGAPRGGASTMAKLAADHPITENNLRFSLWSSAQRATLNEAYQADLAQLHNDLGEDFLRP